MSNWTCVNFSWDVEDEIVISFCHELVVVCQASGMVIFFLIKCFNSDHRLLFLIFAVLYPWPVGVYARSSASCGKC